MYTCYYTIEQFNKITNFYFFITQTSNFNNENFLNSSIQKANTVLQTVSEDVKVLKWCKDKCVHRKIKERQSKIETCAFAIRTEVERPKRDVQ